MLVAASLAACVPGQPVCAPAAGKPVPGSIVGGQARMPVAIAQAGVNEPVSREVAITKGEVFLADAAGRALPGMTVETTSTGGYQLNRVPPGQALVVAVRAKTAAGNDVELLGLARTGDQGATADVNVASTIVTRALLEGQRGAVGDFTQADYDKLIALVYARLGTVVGLDLNNTTAVITLFKTMANASPEIRALYDKLRAQVTAPKVSIEDQIKAIAEAQGLAGGTKLPPRTPAASAGGFGSGNGTLSPIPTGTATPVGSASPATPETSPSPASPSPSSLTALPTPSVTPSLPVPGGDVTTVAGSNAGYRDGDGLTAQFREPSGIVFDPLASIPTLYLADAGNNRLRKILLTDPANPTVTTIAGTGRAGSADGVGVDAEFNTPAGLVFDVDGTLLVADSQGQSVRRVDVRGAGNRVTTVWAPTGSAKFNMPVALALDPVSRVLYLTDVGDHVIRRLAGNDPSLTPSRFAGTIPGDPGSFKAPSGVAVDPNGFLWVADTGKNLIRTVAADGTIATFAGQIEAPGTQAGTPAAYAEGRGTEARFFKPAGLALHPAGFLVVADSGNNRIRRIDRDGTTGLIAGGEAGSADGNGENAAFNRPEWVTVAPDGSIYVSDVANHRIRRIH